MLALFWNLADQERCKGRKREKTFSSTEKENRKLHLFVAEKGRI